MALLRKSSLAKEVSNLIEKEIKEGIYALNQKLPIEPELMQRYGVGRSTIREAIKYLVQLGYVQVLQGVGTFVSKTTISAPIDEKLGTALFEEMFEVRQLLELKIVEKAAINRNSRHLVNIKEKLKVRNQYANEGKISECFHADIEFHNAVAESCGNELLFELYKVLSMQLTKLYFESFSDTSIFIYKNELHEELVKYIESQKPAKALEVAKKIIASP
ncbi:FadR/GntR family transcriptional regulator [Pseudarcicella hirudinis]|nr:GntR family transcriptional regulator [Pseudarcicella hirudinis]